MTADPFPESNLPRGEAHGQHEPSNELRSNLPDDIDADPPLSLAPLDPATEAARQRIREPDRPRPLADAPDPVPLRWQFSLTQLIVANTLLAVVLALFQLFAPHWVAGTLGIVAFALLWLVNIYQPQQPLAYAIAWGSIVLYALVALFALLCG